MEHAAVFNMKKLILSLIVTLSSIAHGAGLITVQIVNDANNVFQYYQVNTWGINKDGSSVNLQYTSPQEVQTAQAILNTIDSGFQRTPTLSMIYINDDNSIDRVFFMVASDAKQTSPTLSPSPVPVGKLSAAFVASTAQVIQNAIIKNTDPIK